MAWVEQQLRAHGLTASRQVFLMTVDEENQVYLVPKEGSA